MPNDDVYGFTINGPHHADPEFVQLSVSPLENGPSEKRTFSVHGMIGVRNYEFSRKTTQGGSRKTYCISPEVLFVREEAIGCEIVPGTHCGAYHDYNSGKEITKNVFRQASESKLGTTANVVGHLVKPPSLSIGVALGKHNERHQDHLHSVETTSRTQHYGRTASGWTIGCRYDNRVHDAYMDDRVWAQYKIRSDAREAHLTFSVVVSIPALNIFSLDQEQPVYSSWFQGKKQAEERAKTRDAVRRRLKSLVAGMVLRNEIERLRESKGYRDEKDDLVVATVTITAKTTDLRKLENATTSNSPGDKKGGTPLTIESSSAKKLKKNSINESLANGQRLTHTAAANRQNRDPKNGEDS